MTFLNRIISQEYPEYIAVVFDTPAPTFRHKAYKEYKATRQEMPEDMVPQIGMIKDVVKAYNIPLLEMEGFEADDIMGTLAKQAEKQNMRTFLVTSDKDFMQLISPKTKMYKPGRSGDEVEIVDAEGVKKKFGVAPDKVIDVLGLIGDTSDNVPGVPGVGEKTAIPLIQKYGSIENLYKNIGKIEQKGLRAKLEANKDLAFLSKQLVTIDTEVPIGVGLQDLQAKARDIATLSALFEELDFRSLLSTLRKGETAPKKVEEEIAATPPPEEALSDIRTDKHTYTLITEEKGFKQLLARLKKATEFVFDTETTSTDALQSELVGISIALQPREAFFIAVQSPARERAHDLFGERTKVDSSEQGLDPELVIQALKPVFERSTTTKIGHNIKYDMLVLSQYGIETAGPFFDTMVASYVLRADGRHGLDATAKEHLRYKMVSYTELTGSGKDQKKIREVPLEGLSDYSCEDSDITFRLYEVFRPKLSSGSMKKLCEDVEFPLVPVLARMEQAGIAIDVEYLRTMSKVMEGQLESLTKNIHKLAGGPFNINSTQQLGEILFTKLGLRTVKKTKTGFSTDVSVLEELRNEHEIVEHLLEYRQLSKLKSTYVDALPALINPKTGRVHTSYNQTIAATGRLSSSDPNLQNIPIRTEIGRSIRKGFIPGKKGNKILSADYSQIELRVMAHISGDEGLTEAFRNKEDVHTTTAAKVFGVPLKEVTRDMRRKAKEVNFGIMYGIGPFGLATRLEISQAEAKEIIARYFERFPKVKHYIHETIETARVRGYVETMLGRRRYLPDLKSGNQNIRSNAERQAINMPIQGSAADMIKAAMIRIDKALRSKGLQTRMLLQVHDELVFELAKGEETTIRTVVTKHMQEALKLGVPLEVEIGVGNNWLEAH
ncbi:MAG: DNA polymerase I [Ignavibacteria bacterium GWA2_55_25]|nr:MAG: DNA polymerase I [Ignavibacteria bacterium GWA2_55_25]